MKWIRTEARLPNHMKLLIIWLCGEYLFARYHSVLDRFFLQNGKEAPRSAIEFYISIPIDPPCPANTEILFRPSRFLAPKRRSGKQNKSTRLKSLASQRRPKKSPKGLS